MKSVAMKKIGMKAAAMKSVAMKTGMKAAMKGMKGAMKVVMKIAMKKKSMKVSKVAKGKLRKAVVFRGGKEKTSGGLTKSQLVKNKTGKVVSKAASAAAKKNFAGSKLEKWGKACAAAKKALGITGFMIINGKTPQGKALYAKAKSI